MTIPLFDTNLLYGLLDPADHDAADLTRLRDAGVIHVSDVSILEWIVRHAHLSRGNLRMLQDGLTLIDGNRLKRLSSPYVALTQNEIDAFRVAVTLTATESLHDQLTQRRISVEHEWLKWALVVALGAYVSHFAQVLFPPSSPPGGQAVQTAEAILASNLTLISDMLHQGIVEGYANGSPERSVNEAIDNLRTSIATAARISFANVAGQSLSESEIKRTLNTDSFRKFMTREAKSGNFAQFLVAAKTDALRPGSAHMYTVEYIFARLDKPLNLGANHRKNDVNDAFIVGHLVDPNVALLTRDKAMIDTLSKPPFRRAITLVEALAALPQKT
jgi:hypothetical protein